jgi:PhzF family phenazine biosynthesis protein
MTSPPSLCDSCSFKRDVRGRRGQRYLLCRNETIDAKYPPQPVLICPGYRESERSAMTHAQLFQVDTFTEQPFSGNPAGVCILDAPAPAEWMQQVATELRMPATAFLWPGELAWTLRWFTVTDELEICGHGTVAAAHVLWETNAIALEATAEFATPAGPITAAKEGVSIFLTLPAGRVEAAEAPPGLLDSVGVAVESVWRTPLDYLLVVDGPQAVAGLEPDIDAIAEITTRGVIVTAAGGEAVDFTSRFFAPRIGVPEDSVTGSAHASLAPFWAERLGKTTLRARQASRRGGFLDLRVNGSSVQVGGPAVTVSRGALLVDR